jgi:hypothetical protein
MTKASRFDVKTPLTWEEDDALTKVANVLAMPKAGVMRLGLLAILKEYAPQEAAKMLRNRITKATILLFAALIPLSPQLQSRRIPRSSTLVRTVAFAVRRQEVTA